MFREIVKLDVCIYLIPLYDLHLIVTCYFVLLHIRST